MRNVTFVALLAVAALLLLVARGADQVEAAPYNPTLTTTLTTTSAAGAVSDVKSVADWGNGPATASREFPASFSGFTPAGWGMPAAGTPGIPVGAASGSAFTITTLGLLNSACILGIHISFSGAAQPPYPGPTATTPLLDASTDGTGADTIAPGTGFVALISDSDSDGIMDGAQHWNTLLTSLLGPLPPGQPIERQVGTTSLFGTTVWVDIPTFSPGVIAPAALGFATLTVVENFSPALPASPSLITDSCGLRTEITQQGLASNGAAHRTNPAPNVATGGTEIFFQISTSDRDADQGPSQLASEPSGPDIGGRLASGGGFVNSDDTCPFDANVGSPHFPVGTGDDIPFGETPTGDGIDGACDLSPSTSTGTGDEDGDIYLNRQDNCPQVPNGIFDASNQTDVLELAAGPPVDGGPANDSIGDACDFAPHGGGRLPATIDHTGVADGHFHTVLNVNPVCVTAAFPGFADSDGDGWCDATEVGGGSSPASPASTPEALSIPTTCSDGVDNDGALGTDLADAKCQLPDHDLAIRKTTGDTVIGGASECQPVVGCGYNTQIQNNTSQDESGQIGFLLDPIFGAGCSSPTATLSGGSASPVLNKSGPINVDGDNDIEYLIVVDFTVEANKKGTVNINVVWPSCGPTVGTPADYLLIADVCHADDIAPLGLFGLQACGGAADGGQDRVSLGNDAPVIRVLNDVGR